MSQARFREHLIALCNEFLEDGGDAFWLFAELNVAGRQLTEDLRCDLVEVDEEGGDF